MNPPSTASSRNFGTESNPAFQDARSYEMLFTVPILTNEDLHDYTRVPDIGKTQGITQFGPPLELHRRSGSEYQFEDAQHSMIEDVVNNSNILAMPPATGTDDDSQRIYRDDRAEVTARARMMANRHNLPDVESELHLGGLFIAFQAGQYIKELKRRDDTPVKINSIIDTVTHDFLNQQTIVHLATIR